MSVCAYSCVCELVSESVCAYSCVFACAWVRSNKTKLVLQRVQEWVSVCMCMCGCVAVCVCMCACVFVCVCMWVCTTQKRKKRERDRKKGGKRIGSREIYQMHFLFIYWPWILTLKAIGLWLQSSAWSVGREEGSSSWRWSLKGWRLSLNFFPDPKNGTQWRCWKYGWAWTHNYTLSSSWPSLVLPHSRSTTRACVPTYTHIYSLTHSFSDTKSLWPLSLFLSHTLSCGQELYQAHQVPIAL